MRIEQFQSFAVSESDRVAIQSDFTLVATDCRLSELSRADCRSLANAESGCYLWLMRAGEAAFKVYVGKTGSIRRRLTDYTVGFQLHSPNDFKLRFFEEAVRELAADVQLDLYFVALPVAECGSREKDYIRRFKPFVNTLPAATETEREPVRDAFRSYYRSAFRRHLDRDA